MKNVNLLKVISFAIAGISFFVAQEVQRRETREMVEEIIAERDAEVVADRIEATKKP